MPMFINEQLAEKIRSYKKRIDGALMDYYLAPAGGVEINFNEQILPLINTVRELNAVQLAYYGAMQGKAPLHETAEAVELIYQLLKENKYPSLESAFERMLDDTTRKLHHVCRSIQDKANGLHNERMFAD